MSVVRGPQTTTSGPEVIQEQISTILKQHTQIKDPVEFEKLLRKSFHEVQEAVSNEAIESVNGWPCEYCEEIFCGRDHEEAGVSECERCSNIVCANCAETHIDITRSVKETICNDCGRRRRLFSSINL